MRGQYEGLIDVTPGRGEPIDAYNEVSSDNATEPHAKVVPWLGSCGGRALVCATRVWGLQQHRSRRIAS